MAGYLFNYIEEIICYEDKENKIGSIAIGIGAHDFWIRRKVLKKCNVTTISSLDLEKHLSTFSNKEFAESSKKLSKLFFANYGYSTYVDLDIYDRADIVFDLSKPIPEDLYQKFDLVFDPTSNYVVNINQSYANTSRLLKIGGIKIVLSILGDQTNRFDLNPSPNYLIDFHTNNGFRLEKAFLMDRTGRIIPYKRYQTKATPVAAQLPFPLFLLYMTKTFLFSLHMRKIVSSAPYIDYQQTRNNKGIKVFIGLSQTARAVDTVKSRIKSFIKRALSENWLNYIRRAKRVLSLNLYANHISPDWTGVVVLRKMEESSYDSFHITAHYRHLDQTK